MELVEGAREEATGKDAWPSSRPVPWRKEEKRRERSGDCKLEAEEAEEEVQGASNNARVTLTSSTHVTRRLSS